MVDMKLFKRKENKDEGNWARKQIEAMARLGGKLII